MINICLLLKLTVEECINHIAGQPIFRLDLGLAERQNWYRTNWIALEFDLLYRWNNSLLEELGLTSVVNAASQQAAGRISLFNNPVFLMESEFRTIQMGRDFRLRSFNDYREAFGYRRLLSYQQLYGPIDNLELVVGLFADLMRTMVAYDAFTQIYTNPLLSQAIHRSEHLTAYGLQLLNDTTSITDLVQRNVSPGETVLASLEV